MINERGAEASSFQKTMVPWLICGIGMLYYCYNYFLRVSPSVMQNELMTSFHISAYQFGHLAAFYYYAYTPMQIPAGMLYDKYGARFVLFCASLTAVVGLGLFISANDFNSAAFGRFLIGLGTAFAYIGTLKLASIWLPTNRFATAAGLTTAFGMTSAIFSQNYLTKVVQAVGYKDALYSVLFIGIVLSFLILSTLRNHPKHTSSAVRASLNAPPMNMKQLLSALRRVSLNPQMWVIGIISCLTYLPATVFLDLWGIPYLRAAYSLTPEQAAYISSTAFMGWILSGPTMGALSDKIKRRRTPLLCSSLMGATMLMIIFYVPGLTFSTLPLVFFVLGFSCGAHPICFALGKENNPIEISGTAIAATNMLTMAGGAFFQPFVGKMLDWHASGLLDARGLPVYSAQDYTFALSVIPISVALGVFMCLFLKETYCRQLETKPSRRAYADSGLHEGRLASETEAS